MNTRQQKRRWFWLLIPAALGICGVWWYFQSPPDVHLPDSLAAELPPQCLQVVLVQVRAPHESQGQLSLHQRTSPTAPWVQVTPPIPVVIGKNGLAWGLGEHRHPPPDGFRLKLEGDGCSPAGIFRLPYAFGYSQAPVGIRLPYQQLTPTHHGVDDPQSRFYNQVVDTNLVQRDWNSHETMLREDGLYRFGAFVAHNPENHPGKGSCIFLHLWRGPAQGTAGCTAMSEADLLHVLHWLDATREPRLIQCLADSR
ncbi:MAG: hypothetical protein JNJ83_19650 [Verrucomicrobiaceae bacterium]|nr:hypothetical protein [Verrucomicrobiaceae bacterium]